MILIIGKDREWFPRMIFWIAHTKRPKEWIWHLGYKRQLKPFCELTVRSIYRLLGCSQMSLSSSFFSPPFTLSFNLAIFWQIHFLQPGPMLLVYAYHTLDYPSPYKTKHEKQGFKIVTLIPADTSTTQAPKRSTNVRSLRLTIENNQTKTTTPAPFTATLEETEKARVLGSISSYTRGSTFLTFLLLSCLFVQSKVNFWTFHPIYFCSCY